MGKLKKLSLLEFNVSGLWTFGTISFGGLESGSCKTPKEFKGQSLKGYIAQKWSELGGQGSTIQRH